MKTPIPYPIQRELLRLRLQAQRAVLEKHIGLRDAGDVDDNLGNNGYRSMTMRLLTGQSGLSSMLLTEIVPLMLAGLLRRKFR